jgi:hypothetical protein
MLPAFIVLLRAIGLICCGHRAVALENLALRQQLAALTRTAHVRIFAPEIDCSGSGWSTCGGTGALPWSLSAGMAIHEVLCAPFSPWQHP